MLTWKNIMGFVVNGNPDSENRVEKPETYWKSVLPDAVFKITRHHGTEPPYSGKSCEALNLEYIVVHVVVKSFLIQPLNTILNLVGLVLPSLLKSML